MTNRPNVFIININPQNWEACLKDHIFGLRVDAIHPEFVRDDVFLVRKTGKDYGVLGIWMFNKESEVSSQTMVPWNDAEYRWLLWFDPLIDFQTPMTEDFAGVSKFSSKIGIPAMRIVGSVVRLNSKEVISYLESIKQEKATELTVKVSYQGNKVLLADVIQGILTGYHGTEEPAVTPPLPKSKERDMPVGDPINFRGMVYAPLNEAGVVLIFSKVMDDLGIIYESSPSTGFDMVGRERTEKGYERKHFEFEFKSSNFRLHKHDASLVDYLVCWEHDWKDSPPELKIIELSQLIKDLPAQFE